MKRTRIFYYNGVLGIESSASAQGVIAKPEPGNGNLGFVVRADACDITPEAKQILSDARREGGSFAPFMLTKHSRPSEEHGKSSFGWLGGSLCSAVREEVMVGRDCDKSVLDDMNLVTDMELPASFKEFVDDSKPS